MPKTYHFDIEIDKLTRSLENAISRDSFKTEVLEVTATDIRKLKKTDWLFDWKAEAMQPNKTIYKLVIVDNTQIIQGLISLQDRSDHVFMSLIESNKFNKGAKKVYLGVPANLVAFACKLSFDKGYSGYVSFESKSRLMEHYQKSLGAHVLFGNIMAIDTRAARQLINQYFPENL
jgi:disulfide oxidoreductase YuzD